MAASILEHLVFLYGQDTAAVVYPRLREVMDRHAAPDRSPVNRDALAFSERDALLITYGDQVREPGQPPLRTLARFLEARVQDLISGVHLLPFYPASSDDGFSVVDYLSVDPALGSWADIASLGSQFDLMFDAVLNHVSARSEWFQRFLQDDPAYRPFFITVEGEADLTRVVRPRTSPLLTPVRTPSGEKKVWTTFSADQVDLNFRHPAVLLVMVDVLLFYVARGARFLRLDAIAYLWKEFGTPCIHLPQTHRIIQLLRAVLDVVAPGVLLITETNVPHADNLSYFGDGTNEAQLVYNFALPPLVLHALRTGRAETLSRWAAGLQTPSRQVTFFNFLASHDGIGLNPARGILPDQDLDALVEGVRAHGGIVSDKSNPDGSKSPYELNINYFDALSNPADTAESAALQIRRFLAAQAVMLALPGVPGIYFHSLFGSRGDMAGAVLTGIPRRINRQKLNRAELEQDLEQSASLRARVFAGYSQLLRARRQHPAFHPCAAHEVLSLAPRLFAFWRIAPDGQSRVLCLHNLANEPVLLAWPPPSTGGGVGWTNLLAGPGPVLAASSRGPLKLAPYEVLWVIPPGETPPATR